jgi:thioredoxin-related protein
VEIRTQFFGVSKQESGLQICIILHQRRPQQTKSSKEGYLQTIRVFMKIIFGFLAYSFSIIIIWGACFMANGLSDAYTAAMGLSFTFLSIYFLQQAYHFNLRLRDKGLILVFPVLYDISVYLALWSDGYFTTTKLNAYQKIFYIHLLNPINIALIMLILGLTKLKRLSKLSNIFIFTYMTLFYSYMFHNQWTYFWLRRHTQNFDTPAQQDDKTAAADHPQIDTSIRLSEFYFINNHLDTITLKPVAGKFILIETWAEWCYPCIKAMNDLPDFYQAVHEKLDVYYVYESDKERVRNQFDKIFKFDLIKEKSKICIDIGQELYKKLGIDGYPYFLLFNSDGKLVYHCKGYFGKDALSKEILKHISGR